jgi:hypothetical protein
MLVNKNPSGLLITISNGYTKPEFCPGNYKCVVIKCCLINHDNTRSTSYR